MTPFFNWIYFVKGKVNGMKYFIYNLLCCYTKMSSLRKDIKFASMDRELLETRIAWFRPVWRVWFFNSWLKFPNSTSTTLYWSVCHDYSTIASPTTGAWDPTESTKSPNAWGTRGKNGLHFPHLAEYAIWPGSHPNPSRIIPIKANSIGGLNAGSQWAWFGFILLSQHQPYLNGKIICLPIEMIQRKWKSYFFSIFTIHIPIWADA